MINKMHTGDIYLPYDKEIFAKQTECLDKLYDFNQTRPTELEKRGKMLKEMFCEIGENCYIEPPFHANFGGKHVHFGNNIYANFNLTLVDDTHIYVGDCTMFGPNVTVATAGHPILPELREQGYQYPHDYPGHWVKQQYLPDELVGTTYYEYGANKVEQAAKQYWAAIKGE